MGKEPEHPTSSRDVQSCFNQKTVSLPVFDKLHPGGNNREVMYFA